MDSRQVPCDLVLMLLYLVVQLMQGIVCFCFCAICFFPLMLITDLQKIFQWLYYLLFAELVQFNILVYEGCVLRTSSFTGLFWILVNVFILSST